jgi:CHRD domain
MVCTVPKSGTHLMIGILESLFGETFFYKPPDHESRAPKRATLFGGRKYVTEADILKNPNLENKFYVGHIQYSEPMYEIIKEIPKILLIRDPRDYLVSMSHYLDQSPGPTHAKYKELPTWDVKVSATIFGMRGGFYAVNEHFDRYFINWVGSPKSTIIRFEDILGPEFGGDEDTMLKTFHKIMNLTPSGVRFEGEALRDKIRVGSDPHKSLTFRPSKRKIGMWKEEFTENHVKQFKLVAPSLVSAMGYEKDENWNLNSESEYSSELNEAGLYSLLTKNRDYASVASRYEKLMEDFVFPSPYPHKLGELVNDWALRQLIDLKAKITAILTALDEVPPKSTKATGAFELELSADGRISNYTLNAYNISNVTSVHLHRGAKGTNGPIIMTLNKNTASPRGQIDNIISKGRILGTQFEGSLAGKYMSDLMQMIDEGNVYINICTSQNPEGEIRGQLLNLALKHLKYHRLSEYLAHS